MKNISIKKIISCAIFFATTAVYACWYNTTYNNDYIYGINNYENHTTATANDNTPTTTDYVVKNNMIIDFPLSISIKLDSNVIEDTSNLLAVELNTVICMLLYRILPDGEWITAAYQEIQPNSITANSPPAFWLGRNNINPLNLKRGDMIMVRLYVLRGAKQTGMLESKCDKTLVNNCLLDSYTYSITKNGEVVQSVYFDTLSEDLGGAWLPLNVVTLKFSGNYRPIR